MSMDCLHMNGSCSTKHPSSGFIEDYLLNLILEWFWSRIYLATIRCFKKSKGLDMQYSKDSEAFRGPYIQYIWLLKRCPVVGKCLCYILKNSEHQFRCTNQYFFVFRTTLLDVATALVSEQHHCFTQECLWRHGRTEERMEVSS